MNPSEPNSPNTIDTCTDGVSGAYNSDESLNSITITKVGGGYITQGSDVEISAQVYVYNVNTDKTDFFYSTVVNGSPSWTLITTLSAAGTGLQTVKTTWTLPTGYDIMAIRGVHRYNGAANGCPGGGYDDVDDLVFMIGEEGFNGETTTTTSSTSSAVTSNNGPQVAVYDGGHKAPKCANVGSECSSDTLLDGRGKFSGSAGLPEGRSGGTDGNNAMGECMDGQSGSYHKDESLDKIVVSSKDGNNLAAGNVAVITANVWSYGSGSSDFADFYYAADASNPVWTLIGTQGSPGGGAQVITKEYTLPEGANQAVRVHFRYGGSASPCSGGSYNDADTLVFAVSAGGGGGGSGPTTTTTATTVSPGASGGPQIATYNPTLGIPTCSGVGSSCDSLGYLNGRGGNSVGPESNFPNTRGTCPDGNSGTYHKDESMDHIIVNSVNGGDLQEGMEAEIVATVYSYGSGSSDRLDFFYAADAANPTWMYIGTQYPPAGGVQVLSMTYTLPKGANQAVRANFRYSGSVPANACSTGNYDDTDDLGFAVKANPNYAGAIFVPPEPRAEEPPVEPKE
jgi:hypothetical protein